MSPTSNPLRAAYYADAACYATVEVIENVQLARDTFRVRLDAADIARRILPGQFVMLRISACDDPLLGRALALYDTVVDVEGKARGIDLVYLVVGKLTSRLARLTAGARLDVWGPLGNGFEPRALDHLIMVAGGIGQTPFLALAKEHLGKGQYGTPARHGAQAAKVTFCYGVRTADLLAGVEDFEQTGVHVRISSDDGSAGHHGLVTDVLAEVLQEDSPQASRRVVCCGPEPMMEAVAQIAAQADVPCEVSLETPMACGIGICFSCVARVRQDDGGWDYKRTCVDGPVFDAAKIEW